MKWCQKGNYVNTKEQKKFLSVLFNLGVAKLRGILLDLLKVSIRDSLIIGIQDKQDTSEESLFITDSTGSKHIKEVLNEEDEISDDESMKKLAGTSNFHCIDWKTYWGNLKKRWEIVTTLKFLKDP